MKRFVFFNFFFLHTRYMCMFPVCYFRQRTYVAQGLVNKVFNETLIHSCFRFVFIYIYIYIYIYTD